MSEYPYVDFIEYLVKSIVDNPNDVRVERRVDEMGVLLTLKVNAADMGQVVGRNGATAKAIRTLLRIVGIKANARVNLKIEEPDGGRGPRRPAEGEARPGRPSAPTVPNQGEAVASRTAEMDDLKL